MRQLARRVALLGFWVFAAASSSGLILDLTMAGFVTLSFPPLYFLFFVSFFVLYFFSFIFVFKHIIKCLMEV